MRTIREQELMLAAALDAVYQTLNSARVRAYDLKTAVGGHLGGELGAMARRCSQLAQEIEERHPNEVSGEDES